LAPASQSPYILRAPKKHGRTSAGTPGDRVASVFSAAADFFWSVIDFLQRYSGAVTAGATVAIGLFTFFLIYVTNRQARLTRKSIDLARQGFIATHRPKIKIHAVEIVDREVDSETFIGASILAFNIGESAAKNVEVRGQIFMAPGFALNAQRPLVKTFDEVLSGQKLRAEITSDYRASYAAASRRTGIYCLGWIAYWDESEQRRETGFCVQLEFGADSGRWVSAGKPEYEYDY
jgi:hypothetical protein